MSEREGGREKRDWTPPPAHTKTKHYRFCQLLIHVLFFLSLALSFISFIPLSLRSPIFSMMGVKSAICRRRLASRSFPNWPMAAALTRPPARSSATFTQEYSQLVPVEDDKSYWTYEGTVQIPYIYVGDPERQLSRHSTGTSTGRKNSFCLINNN